MWGSSQDPKTQTRSKSASPVVALCALCRMTQQAEGDKVQIKVLSPVFGNGITLLFWLRLGCGFCSTLPDSAELSC
jgi:hypothetical protein